VIVTGTGDLDLSGTVFHTPRTQGAHTHDGTRQTEAIAKWLGGSRLSRGEGAFYDRRAHISFRDRYIAQAGNQSGVVATRSRPDAL
jgi:hypothetical protein